jgi:hypothetical protein
MHAELDVAPEAAIGRVCTEEVLPVQLASLPDTSTFPGAERRTAMDAHGATPGVNASAVDPPHRLSERPAPRARMSACRRREHQSCSYDANGSPQDQPSEQKSHGAPQATSADRLFPQGPTAETSNGGPFGLIGHLLKQKVGGTRSQGEGRIPPAAIPRSLIARLLLRQTLLVAAGQTGSRPLLPKGSLEPGHAYLLPWAGRAVSLPQAFGGHVPAHRPRGRHFRLLPKRSGNLGPTGEEAEPDAGDDSS